MHAKVTDIKAELDLPSGGRRHALTCGRRKVLSPRAAAGDARNLSPQIAPDQ